MFVSSRFIITNLYKIIIWYKSFGNSVLERTLCCPNLPNYFTFRGGDINEAFSNTVTNGYDPPGQYPCVRLKSVGDSN